jgi:hypothetical protein
MRTILLILLFLFCKPKSENELHSLSINNKLANEEAILLISKKIFGDKWKNLEIEKTEQGFNQVYINYGNNIAYTFYTESNYKEKIQLEVARNLLIFSYYTRNKSIDSIRISLTKPYHVKRENKESVEDFEIFRAKVFKKDIEKLLEENSIRYILNDDKRYTSNVKEILNQLRLAWKIELNELDRIEVK